MKDVRKDFPILNRIVNNSPLIYLDNAATSQKPKEVVDKIVEYYYKYNSNVHRGIHTLSEESTEMYEGARKLISDFIGADNPREILFTKGTTESLNRIAERWVPANLKRGDVILLSDLEHHSNIVPWQKAAERIGAEINYINTDDNGEITIEEVKKMISDKVKLISISHASNVLGTIVPIKEICKLAHDKGIYVCVDGAQAAPHLKINVQSLGCDFYAFSSHKMLGPMGVGVLWAKEKILKELEPYEYGGGMIDEVSFKNAAWAEIPIRFEAGTPNVSGAVGLGAAVTYLSNIGMDNIRNHEIELSKYLLERLKEIKGINIIGPREADKRTGLISFYFLNIHSHDIASVLNTLGIAVRSGYHCAMPLHNKLNIPSTVRVSYYLYNTKEELNTLLNGIKKAVDILS